MLSVWKLRVGAEDYYLEQVAKGLDDYYSGAGETQGEWIGTASGALGLEHDVAGGELRAVLAGLAPGTGLTPNNTQVRTFKNRVPGFDLTFSAPKSVSILYALGDPLVRAQVVEATDLAVAEALAGLNAKHVSCDAGPTPTRTRRPSSTSGAPVDSPVPGSSRPSSGIAQAAKETRNSTPTSWSRT